MKKISPKILIIGILSALLLTVGGAFLIYSLNFVSIGGKTFSVSVTAVDLSGSGVTDISSLNRLTRLETADVSGGSVSSLPRLENCQSLRLLKAEGSSFSAQECVDFLNAHPDAALDCGVVIGGSSFPSLAGSVSPSDAMEDADIRGFAALRRLQTLDLTGSVVSDETFEYLRQALPGCEIARSLMFEGTEYLSTADTVKLPADFTEGNLDEKLARLKYFPSLEVVDASAISDTAALIDLKNRLPQYAVRWNITVMGVKTDTAAEELDLNRKKYSRDQFIAEFDEKFPLFHNLKKVYMLSCGLYNADMDVIINRYPDIKFVWYVSVARWKVRSDAVSFSTLIQHKSDGRQFTEASFAPLFKYCTDLVALDMGHCHIMDLTQFANLKNLRGLILTDNFVNDLSPLSKLEKLQFIEMNSNYVKSVAPLAGLKDLQMVNLYNSHDIKDLSPLYNHSSLRMVIFDKEVPKDEQQRFIDTNPDCMTFFAVENELARTTTVAWRADALREKFKQTFRHWKNVTGFDEETETFTFDYKIGPYSY